MLWKALGLLCSVYKSHPSVPLISCCTFSDLFHASLDLSHCVALWVKPLWRCCFGARFCVCAGCFCLSNRTGAVMGKFFPVALHLFSTGHTAFPDGLQLCSLAPGAIQGVHSPVCQPEISKITLLYTTIWDILLDCPKIGHITPLRAPWCGTGTAELGTPLKERRVRHGEITQALIHTGSELIHSGSEQSLHGFDHADLALWASVWLTKSWSWERGISTGSPSEFWKSTNCICKHSEAHWVFIGHRRLSQEMFISDT